MAPSRSNVHSGSIAPVVVEAHTTRKDCDEDGNALSGRGCAGGTSRVCDGACADIADPGFRGSQCTNGRTRWSLWTAPDANPRGHDEHATPFVGDDGIWYPGLSADVA